MKQHIYLRAYMAGIVVPTIVLLAGAAAFSVYRYVYNVPVPIERIIVFPMAVVPNLWGVWNMLYIASHSRTHLPLAIHGALLPFILGPLGMLLTSTLDFQVPNFVSHIFPVFAAVALIAYYLVWKYIVGFLNGFLGIA
jgi:hypothetical protein